MQRGFNNAPLHPKDLINIPLVNIWLSTSSPGNPAALLGRDSSACTSPRPEMRPAHPSSTGCARELLINRTRIFFSGSAWCQHEFLTHSLPLSRPGDGQGTDTGTRHSEEHPWCTHRWFLFSPLTVCPNPTPGRTGQSPISSAAMIDAYKLSNSFLFLKNRGEKNKSGGWAWVLQGQISTGEATGEKIPCWRSAGPCRQSPGGSAFILLAR